MACRRLIREAEAFEAERETLEVIHGIMIQTYIVSYDTESYYIVLC